MKRVIASIIAVLLIVALCVPAVADVTLLYTQKSVKVYEKKSTKSDVIKKIGKGKKLLIETKTDKWCAILVEAADGEGQRLGWIQSKYLGKNKPSSDKKEKKHKKKTTPKPGKKATPKPAPKATPAPTLDRAAVDHILAGMAPVAYYPVEVRTMSAGGTVALRREPAVLADLIAYIESGRQLTVLAEGDGWFQVRDDATGSVGYMASRYLFPIEQDEVALESEDAASGAAEAPAPADGVVQPMRADIDLGALQDGVYSASFSPDSLEDDGEGLLIKGVHIYTQDIYAAADIDALAAGGRIAIDGTDIAVETLSRDEGGDVLINGGVDENGWTLRPYEDDGYTVAQWDDYPTWTDQGTVDLKLTADAVFTDSTDLEAGARTAGYGEIEAAFAALEDGAFDVTNTLITLEDGAVIAIDRIFTP